MSAPSVLTIAAGRETHLANVLAGLARQTRLPGEVVIARMQDTSYTLDDDLPFPVRQVHVPGRPLPLAAARNAAARAATGERLIFLDVDCIPEPSLVADYDDALGDTDALLMGEVMYLPAHAADPGWSYAAFDAVAERHSDRRGPPATGIERCNDYRCFWSLNFALSRALFDRVGGLDECFAGYGGEDTDFAKTVDQAGETIAWMKGAKVYHQHHPHHMPPIHHIETVVRNAQMFADKWGYRTMEHWLRAFRLMGLIDEAANGIRILRAPTPDEVAMTLQTDDKPYVNTARVLKKLEARRDAEAMAAE